MTNDISDAVVDKFFERVINATDLKALRRWLRKQPAEEIEIFRRATSFEHFPDRAAILDQELARREGVDARRSAWIDRAIGFATGVATALLGAWLAG